MNEYGQERITLEKSLRAYQETGITPIGGTPGRVVDGRVIEGCLTGAIGLYEGFISVPEGTGSLPLMDMSGRVAMNVVYGTHYLSCVELGFDMGIQGGGSREPAFGFNREGWKIGYEVGEHIRHYGIPKLAVPDYAPAELEKECVA